VFGFAALKPVLIDTGVYRELCTAEELAEDVDVCYEQELRYITSLSMSKIALIIEQDERLLRHSFDDL